MNFTVVQQLNQLDEALDSLLARLTAHSDEALNLPSKPGKWSAIQTLYHLKLAEAQSAQYIQKKLSFNPDLKKAGPSDAIRVLIMQFLLWAPIKTKAPEYISGSALPDFATLGELGGEWKEERLKLRLLLESLPEDIFDKALYKHPVAGRLSISGMLRFFESHFARHKKQIIANLEKINVTNSQ